MHTMTATDIRAQIDNVTAGDLRGVPAALATTGARTESARMDLRNAIARREQPIDPWMAASPAYRARYRAIPLVSSPTTRVKYRCAFAVAAPVLPLSERLAAFKARRIAARDAADLAAVRGHVVASYDRCNYRVAKGTWAGGTHDVRVRLGTPDAQGETTVAWSANRKWRGLDSLHTLTVRASWCAIDTSARVVGGLLTLEMGSLPVESRIYRATWAEQGRGTTLATRHGFLVDCGTAAVASWKHADTLAGARKVARDAVAPVAATTTVDVTTLDADALLRRARLTGNERVTMAIAHDGGRGACYAGMRDWCSKRGIDGANSITARELATMACDSRDRVREVYPALLATKRAQRAVNATVAA